MIDSVPLHLQHEMSQHLYLSNTRLTKNNYYNIILSINNYCDIAELKNSPENGRQLTAVTAFSIWGAAIWKMKMYV